MTIHDVEDNVKNNNSKSSRKHDPEFSCTSCLKHTVYDAFVGFVYKMLKKKTDLVIVFIEYGLSVCLISLVSIQAKRSSIAYMESTVVDISIPPLSLSNLFHCFLYGLLYLKQPKQVFFNPINIF